jgi:RpiR family transcriptional regulator, repressor of rpiB and als operon
MRGGMPGTDPKAVGPRIRMALPSLTPLEVKVVESVFKRENFDETTSIKEVAEGAGVSEAMVAKISKKLGFNGFRDFRAGVAEYLRLPTADLHQDLSLDDSSEQIVHKVFRSAIQALEETLAILDLNAFDRATDILYRAAQRNFYGVGGSAQIARDVSHKFLRIGIQTSVYDDPHMMLMSASLLGPDDAVIGFSHSGATTAVLDAVAIARKQGARTIAVTSYASSPLAELADVVLASTSRGSPLLGENAAARIAQLNILDAIFVAVAQRDYRAAERNLAKTMGAVTSKRKSPWTKT